MSALVGARDYLLANAPTRYLVSTVGKSLVLAADSPVFAVSQAGAGLPLQVKITASLISIDGPVVFSAPAGTAIMVDGHIATLKFADMGADQVTISASVFDADSNATYLASQTISKVFDGAAGRQTALVYAYIRSAAAPAGNPGAVTFDFTTGKISLPAGDALANGYSKSIPAGSDPLYVAVASASGTASTDSIAAAEWAAAVKLAENGRPGLDGAPGINTATISLYQRSDSTVAPERPTAPATYTFATGALTGLTGGWSQTVPGGGGSQRYLFITTATAASADPTDVIAASEWATVRTMARNGADGANGTDGIDGAPGRQTALVYAYIRSATAPAAGPGAVTFDFTTGRIVSPTGNALANGYSKTIPAGANPLYVAVASASSITATDDIAAGEWAAAVVLAENGADGRDGRDGDAGAPGLNAATVSIYQRSDDITSPARPSAVTTYAFGTGVLSGIDNGWSQAVPAGAGRYLFVSTATAASAGATDTIAPGEWAAVRILAQNGQRGTVTISAGGHPTWTDAGAAGEIANAGYGAPIDRDIVTLYSGTNVVTKFFQGGQWYAMTMKIDGNLLVTGSVAAGALNVAALSAITAILGNVTAGDLYGTTMHGGPGYPTNVYGWPSPGAGGGFHLSAAGLLLGNPADGGYVEINSTGYVGMPGLEIIPGKVARFSGKLDAASGSFAGSLTGRNVTASNLATEMALVGTLIRSQTYVPGQYGWMINADGTAEFSALSITGRPTGPATGYSDMSTTPVTLLQLGSATGIAAAHIVRLTLEVQVWSAAAAGSIVTVELYRGSSAGNETTFMRSWQARASTTGGGVWQDQQLDFFETIEVAVPLDAGRTGAGVYFKGLATRAGASTSGTFASITLTTNVKNPTT